jgi:hypothetical protein
MKEHNPDWSQKLASTVAVRLLRIQPIPFAFNDLRMWGIAQAELFFSADIALFSR